MLGLIYNMFLKSWPFFIIMIPCLLGMQVDVLDIDSSQYAAMSKEMLETDNYLKIYNRGQDYLDKPPLLFWVSAFMYSIFGVSHFVFRIIPVLMAFAGVYATYRFTLFYYNRKTGYYASLIFASSQAFFLMNHDVRTDTMLTSFTILSIWLISAYLKTNKLKYLLAGFFCLGLAMLAKGPIGLMVPVTGIGAHLFFTRQWGKIFNLQWFYGILITCIVLMPMCYGLYLQYDSDETKQESGLYFYFWKQSFGRLTGENEWSNNPSITFLAENFLWSFLPWTLLFIPAILDRAFTLFKKNQLSVNHFNKENISFFGFIIPFVALSSSKYQLPHYIYVLFPFAAIICANYLYQKEFDKMQITRFKFIQIFLSVIVILILCFLGLYCFPNGSIWMWHLVIIGFVIMYLLFYFKKDLEYGVILPSLIMISSFNIFMNGHFYPSVMKYQSGSVIGKYIKNNKSIDKNKLYIYGKHLRFYAVDFYSDVRAPEIKSSDAIPIMFPDEKVWIYTDEKGLNEFSYRNEYKVNILLSTDRFHVSTLTIQFLIPHTRQESCHPVFLIEVIKK